MSTITTFAVRSNGRTVVRKLDRERIAAKAQPIPDPEETAEAAPAPAYVSKADLVAMAEEQGVDTSGTRAELAERLGVAL